MEKCIFLASDAVNWAEAHPRTSIGAAVALCLLLTWVL